MAKIADSSQKVYNSRNAILDVAALLLNTSIKRMVELLMYI